MNEKHEEVLQPLAIGIVVLLVLFSLSFCFLYDNRSGDAGVGERIDTATSIIRESGKQQSAITSGIEKAQREANVLGTAINQSYKQTERVESEVNATGEAIRQCRESVERCQQLITTIKARAEPNTK